MSRPNIVVVMTDQQRWDTLGVYGNEHIHTPNLDRLANGGALFEQAFVPIPLCVPSRASLFTGRYPNRGGIGTNAAFPLPAGTPNLASSLRDAGYRTMLVGKDHLFGSDGLARCFDQVVRYDHSGRALDDGGDEHEYAVRSSRHGRYDEWFIERDEHSADHSPTRRLTSAAIDAVRDASGAQQPFFLWLSYPDPHPPYVVAEPYGSLYRDKKLGVPASRPGELDQKPLRQRLSQQLMRMADYAPADLQRVREIYCGMVTFIDDEVGRFAASLDEEGLLEETIFVYMSDHGDYLGDHGMVRKSPAMYDCLVRIPFFIRWPGRIQPARIRNTMMESVDIASTLLDLAGLPALPGDAGTSLTPLLLGQSDTHKDRVFGLYGVEGDAATEASVESVDFDALLDQPHPWMGSLTMSGRMAMVRTLEWKLVYYRGGDGELYDLRQDPNELENRYRDNECSGVRDELMRSLVDFLLDTADPA